MEYLDVLWWLCPGLFIAGLVDAIGGGGGLISIPLYMMAGLPIRTVYGCNRFQYFVGSTATAWRFSKDGFLDFKAAVLSGVGAALGAVAGIRIVYLLTDEQVRTLLLIALPLAAIFSVFGKKLWGHTALRCDFSSRRNQLILFLCGFFVGVYDGVIGPPGTTISIMLLSYFLKYDPRTASANSRFVLMGSTFVASVIYFLNGSILWQIALPCTIANLVGSYLGTSIAVKRGPGLVRYVAIIVVLLYVGKTFLETIL